MAIRLIDRYPSRANPATSQYPHGSGRNKSDPTADDGTPFDEDRFNDQEAFFQGLCERAGITPSGNVDTVGTSDYIDALRGSFIADSLADLQSFPTQYAVDGFIMQTAGRSAFGDGGEGHFRWDSSDLSTDVQADEVTNSEGDGGIYVAPASDKTGASGAWVRIHVNTVTPEMYGAKGDALGDDGSNSTDDTAAFQAAADYRGRTGGGGVTISAEKAYLIDSDLDLPEKVFVLGGNASLGESIQGGNGSDSYESYGSRIALDSSASIRCDHSAGVRNCLIERKGLSTPFADSTEADTAVSNFAGTAILQDGSDVFLENILILGFQQGVTQDPDTPFKLKERLVCNKVYGDCTNGINVSEATDVPRLFQCHFFPFLTTRVSGASSDRSGDAFHFEEDTGASGGEGADWGSAVQCFSFGYRYGFRMTHVNSVRLIGCGADHSAASSTQTDRCGFRWEGNIRRGAMIGCNWAAMNNGVELSIDSMEEEVVRITSCNGWNCENNDVDVVKGGAIISGCSLFEAGGSAIAAFSGMTNLSVQGNYFNDCEVANGDAISRGEWGGNIYNNCTRKPSSTNNGSRHREALTDIPDDDVHSFQLHEFSRDGIIIIKGEQGQAAIILYDSDDGVTSILTQSSSAFEVSSGPLNGTTGTDGKITVSVDTGGVMYIENRRGASRAPSWSLLASADNV